MVLARRAAGIRARALRKSYGPVLALDDVTFDVEPGEVFGVLGPNGAGKTSLIEILEGVRVADSGEATLLGCSVADRAGLRALRHRIGVAMQKTVLPPQLTARELLDLYAAIYPRCADVDGLTERLGLVEKQHARVRELSGGQQQRLAVGLSLVGEPDLLFLDEPTSQLDPQGRRAVWDLLLERKARNSILMLTTHQMEEAERLCTKVAVIDHGRILALGAPADLIERHCPGQIVRFTTSPEAELSFLAEPIERLSSGPDLAAIAIHTMAVERVVEKLMSARAAGRLVVENLRTERHSLEDVFLRLTGRTIRD